MLDAEGYNLSFVSLSYKQLFSVGDYKFKQATTVLPSCYGLQSDPDQHLGLQFVVC